MSRDRPWEAQRGVSRPRAASKTCYLLTGGGGGQVWTEEEKTQGKHVLTQSFHSSMVSFEEVASVRNSRLLVQEKQNVFFTAQYHLVKLKIYRKRTMPILQEPIQTEGYKHITYIRMVVYEEGGRDVKGKICPVFTLVLIYKEGLHVLNKPGGGEGNAGISR